MGMRERVAVGVLGVVAVLVGAGVTLAGGRGRGPGAPPATGPRGRAPTLNAVTGATTVPDEQGFIRRWALLEPMAANGIGEKAFREVALKEHFAGQLKMVPGDGQKVTADGAGLTWHAYDTTQYNVNLYHFSYALGKATNNMIWYVATVVNAAEEMKDVRLAIGSNDASIWWVNGEELVGLYENRMDTFDDGVSKRVTLKKGANVIWAAIGNEMGPTDFCARLLDKEGKPLKNVTVSVGEAAK